MKKVLCLLLLLLVTASTSYGQYLVGARASGMGGVGVAACRDLSAAYYNPAALMAQGRGGAMLSAGAAYSGMDQLASALSNSGDPAKLVTDNFSKNLSVNGSLSGLLGVNINKIGLTVLPNIGINLSKPANSLAASGNAGMMYTGVLTAGYTFALPALPALNVGANLKYLGSTVGGVNVMANLLGGASGNETVLNSSGFGVDLGALMTFDIPLVTSISVGAVLRDLGESVTTSGTTKTLTAATGSSTYTEGPEITIPSSSRSVDSSFALGAAGTIPVVGILLAGDLETGNGFSNTHLGLEYPLLLNVVTLRAGIASGTNLSLTTIGAKIGIPFLSLNAAYVMDGKINNNNSVVLDLAGGF
ncbi:MAG TPA: hypothetical protein VMD02_03670 [Candidatus Omnitrophota bacterium]|nr:hypothetical protein [Candidatus Omnitrophota bacterium]